MQAYRQQADLITPLLNLSPSASHILLSAVTRTSCRYLAPTGVLAMPMPSNTITMTYSTIHKVLGEGNFVLTVSEGQIGGVHSSFYDLFRVENGKIAEHWDTIEPIASKETWKNQNGKFNF